MSRYEREQAYAAGYNLSDLDRLYDEEQPKTETDPRPRCHHVCLKEQGHDGDHFYGYEL